MFIFNSQYFLIVPEYMQYPNKYYKVDLYLHKDMNTGLCMKE